MEIPEPPADPLKPWWMTAPPVCVALLPIDPIRGQLNINLVWEAEIIAAEGEPDLPLRRSVFKHLNHPGKLPVEMACALTALILGNKVPPPCLVRAQASDLSGATADMQAHGALIMFGSSYVDQDSFFEQLSSASDDTLNSAVWNSFCGDAPKAAKAAALDELIANWDRHSRNLRFDGKSWWLIDHDNCLGNTLGKDASQISANFRTHQNHIAGHLRTRRPNDHDMPGAARRSHDKQEQVLALAAAASQWKNSDPAITAIWQQSAVLIELLARRLPMLQQLLGERIGQTSDTPLQWTPSPPPLPPAPAGPG